MQNYNCTGLYRYETWSCPEGRARIETVLPNAFSAQEEGVIGAGENCIMSFIICTLQILIAIT
jgi:hypothetical protein